MDPLTQPARVVDELSHLAEPGRTAVTSPRFIGFVIGGTYPVAAD